MVRLKVHTYIFPATSHIPTLWPCREGEMNGSDPWTWPFWSEPWLVGPARQVKGKTTLVSSTWKHVNAPSGALEKYSGDTPMWINWSVNWHTFMSFKLFIPTISMLFLISFFRRILTWMPWFCLLCFGLPSRKRNSRFLMMSTSEWTLCNLGLMASAPQCWFPVWVQVHNVFCRV